MRDGFAGNLQERSHLFEVTGTDTSDIALEKAKEKASKAKVECYFMLADFLNNKIEGAPLGFAFDRGCFHSFSSENDRKRFAQNVAAHLEEAGLWFRSVNADEDRQVSAHRNGLQEI